MSEIFQTADTATWHLNSNMVSSTSALTAVVVAVLSFLSAQYYYKHFNDKYLDTVLKGLLSLERDHPLQGIPKVAACCEATVDVFVDALDLFHSLGIEPPKKAEAVDVINTEAELAESFAFFFKHSAASSRYVVNKELFRRLVSKSQSLMGSFLSVGGTGVMIAKRLVKEGCEGLAAGELSKSTQKLLPDKLAVIGEVVDYEDFHLLLEYPANVEWGEFKSQRANRMVLHSDEHNPQFKSLDRFFEETRKFSPKVVAVGGLHMMDNFPYPDPEQGVKHLQKFSTILANIPQNIPIHFEMAPFHQEELFQELLDKILPYANSLGMNEQELPNLRSNILYGNITKVASQKPRVATVLDYMRDVYKKMQKNPTNNGRRRPSRLHIHTLAFQAILTAKKSHWKNPKAAVAKASLTATRHVCGSEVIDTGKSKLFMDDSFSVSVSPGSQRVPFNASDPVSCWDEEDYEICIAPVLVCTQVKQTGGGGDHITAGGLVLQI